MTPAGTSIDVQNGWEENTHTHTHQPVLVEYSTTTTTVVFILITVWYNYRRSRYYHPEQEALAPVRPSSTVRGANPTLYARKKLSGLFEQFPKVQLKKK